MNSAKLGESSLYEPVHQAVCGGIARPAASLRSSTSGTLPARHVPLFQTRTSLHVPRKFCPAGVMTDSRSRDASFSEAGAGWFAACDGRCSHVPPRMRAIR